MILKPAQDRYTIDDAPTSGFHYRMALFTAGGKFIDGYSLGVLSVALAVLPPHFGMTPFYSGLVGSSALIGLFLGSFFIGPMADRLGRKLLYTLDLILFLIAAIAQFFVRDPLQLFVTRLVLGIAIGIDYAVGPTYLSEMLNKKLRGPLLGSLTVVWRVGFLCSVIVGYFLRDMGPDAWRWMLLSSAVPTVLVMLLRLGAPESPRWLVRQNREAEADAIVKKYIHPEAGIHDLVATVGHEHGPKRTMLESMRILFSKQWRVRTLFSGFFWIAQATPQTAIFTFLPALFMALGLGGGLGPTLAQNIFFAGGGVVGMFIINLVTRRAVLISTFWLMALSILPLVVLPQPAAAVVIICLCTWSFLEAIGGNLQFVYPSELFPTSLRAAGVGTAAAISRIGAAIGTFALPQILSAYGVQVVMFGALCLLVLGALASKKYAPETSNRGLQEEGPDSFAGPVLGGVAPAT